MRLPGACVMTVSVSPLREDLDRARFVLSSHWLWLRLVGKGIIVLTHPGASPLILL